MEKTSNSIACNNVVFPFFNGGQLDKKLKQANKEQFIVDYARQLKECRRARREKGKVIRQYGLQITKKQSQVCYFDNVCSNVTKSGADYQKACGSCCC
jgi:hypothetical protein